MNKTFPILGIDVGGTKVALCLGMSDGTIISTARIANKDRSSDEVLPEIVIEGKKLLKNANIAEEDLKAIGIGSPAPHDIKNGIILNPANMPLWRNVKIKEYLSKAFNKEVFFNNDANAGALAEWIFGAGAGGDSMIYLTMSTGIGGGIIMNGSLLEGVGGNAGEMGHFCIDKDGPQCGCGMRGCYEVYCGGRSVANRLKEELANKPESAIVKEAGDLENIDMIALENAVRSGDDFAVKYWDNMMLRNAQAIGGYMNVFNPERIVLGTLAWATGDMFMNPLKKYLPQFTWEANINECSIEVSKLGREIGEYAGLSVALYGLYKEGKWQLPWEK